MNFSHSSASLRDMSYLSRVMFVRWDNDYYTPIGLRLHGHDAMRQISLLILNIQVTTGNGECWQTNLKEIKIIGMATGAGTYQGARKCRLIARRVMS